MFAVRVLGGLEVRANGAALPLGTRKQRTLLALLAIHSGRAVGIDQIIDELWPSDPPASAVANARTYAANLRRLFDAVDPRRGLLCRQGDGYLLRPDASNVDLEGFLVDSRAGREARAEGDDDKAAALLSSALAYWRGPMLTGLPHGPQLSAYCAAIEEERLAIKEELAELHLTLGQPGEAARLMRDHVKMHPLREHAQALLVMALGEAGDTAGALAAYGAARRALVHELGLEPGIELQRAHRAILERDMVEVAPRPVAPEAGTPRCWLPRPVADFTGHADLVAQAVASARSAGERPVVQSYDGMAGCGKTTLAVHIAHQLADRFPDGQLFVDLQGHGKAAPLEVETALLTLLRQLGIPTGRIPADLENRAAMWRAELAVRRVIVVLDNAASSEQVNPLLPVSGRSITLVTSRRRLVGLDGVRPESLPMMPSGEAIELLARVVGVERVEAELDAAEDVVHRCGYLPLAIRLVGARLAHRPGWRLADLARHLRHDSAVLPVLAAEDRSVVSAFASSYEPLPEPAKRMFRLLGLWPGQHFQSAAAAALSDMSLPTAESVIAELVDQHLVEEPHAGTFRMHDLMHQYAAALVQEEETAAEREAAFAEVLDHYLQSAAVLTESFEIATAKHTLGLVEPRRPDLLPKNPKDLDWLEAERANIRALVRRAAELQVGRPAWQLARAAWRFNFIRGYYDEILDTHQHGLDAAERAGDLAGIAAMHNYVASAYHRIGRQQAALDHLEAAVRAHRRNEDAVGVYASYANIAVVYVWLGRLEDAVRAFEEVKWYGYGRGVKYVFNHTLPTLGMALTFLGRYQEALRVHRLHLAAGREQGDEFHVAQALGHLGAVRNRLGQPTVAIRLTNASLALRRRTGNRYAESETINELAVAYRLLGELIDAEYHHRVALDGAIAANERFVECAILNDLGLTLRAAGRIEEAHDAYTRGLALATKLANPYEQARGLIGIGECVEKDDPATARHHWERALVLCRKMNVPEQYLLERRLSR